MLRVGGIRMHAIINPAAKWLRIGSKSGVAFWGNENADNDDSPQF